MTPIDTARWIGLQRTWRKALDFDWYARQLARSPDQFSLADLSKLTPLSREQLRSLSEDWLDRVGRLPNALVFTGGRTGAPLLHFNNLVPQSDSIGVSHDSGDTPPSPLMIVTSGGAQGSRPFNPIELGAIVVPLRSRNGYKACWTLLNKSFAFAGHEDRVSVLALPLPAVKKLVHFILDERLDRSQLALRSVATYSAYLSPSWRELIENVLRAPVTDHFGMTEVMSARATECDFCGHYHYGDNAIAEYDTSGRIVQEGTHAHLLLTSLLEPREDNVPVLRYETGDIVQIGPVCPAHGERGFRPRGRRNQALRRQVNGREEYILLGADILDFIDTHAWVARIANVRHGGVTRTEDESFCKWRLEQRDDHATLRIELTSGTAIYPSQWKEFECALRSHLVAANPAFDRALNEQKLRFLIEPCVPGAIADTEIDRY